MQSDLSFLTFLRKSCHADKSRGKEERQNECRILHSAGRGCLPVAENFPQAPLEVTGDLSPMFGKSRRSHPSASLETIARPMENEAGVRGQKGGMGKLLLILILEGKAALRRLQSDAHLGPPTSGLSRWQRVGCTCHPRDPRAARDAPRRDLTLGPGLGTEMALTGYTCRCTHWRWSRCRHSSLQRCSS